MWHLIHYAAPDTNYGTPDSDINYGAPAYGAQSGGLSFDPQPFHSADTAKFSQ